MKEKKGNVTTIFLTDAQQALLKEYMDKRLITTKSRAFVDALVFAHNFLFGKNCLYNNNSNQASN